MFGKIRNVFLVFALVAAVGVVGHLITRDMLSWRDEIEVL